MEFIFSPGFWLGEGKISFSSSSEFIKFYTKWEISAPQEGKIIAIQTVEMMGIEEQVVNHFTFQDYDDSKTFVIFLENQVVSKVEGTGVRDDTTLAWEFRNQTALEGFEVYEKQENGDYFFHAEYGTPEQYRTLIEGLIWKKG